MRTSIVLVANPHSGPHAVPRKKLEAAISGAGIEIVDVVSLDNLGKLESWSSQTEEEGPVVVAAGGDGTVGAVAGKLINSPATMGILPLGTSNDIVRSLQIPIRLHDAIELLKTGKTVAIDVGQFVRQGGPPETFVHAAAIGINVAFSRLATEPSFRKRLGPFTYAAAGLLALRDTSAFHCELSIDGKSVDLDLMHLSVVNAPVFGGILGFEMPGSSVDDHRLDVLAVEPLPFIQMALELARLLLGGPGKRSGVHLYHIQKMGIEVTSPLEVSLDGEVRSQAPGEFELAAGALRVITPRQFPASPIDTSPS